MKTAHKPFPVIDKWLEQYKKTWFRYTFLILWGPSKMGKTELARSYFKNPFEHRDNVCWTGYDDERHDAIIFDDVKCVYRYIRENRALFQGCDCAVVQTSATNVYARTIDVAQKPIVVTTNDRPWGDDWIRANSVQVEINEPTYSADDSRIVRDEPENDVLPICFCKLAYCPMCNER